MTGTIMNRGGRAPRLPAASAPAAAFAPFACGRRVPSSRAQLISTDCGIGPRIVARRNRFLGLNGRFTRLGTVRFVKGECFCFIASVPYETFDAICPRIRSFDDAPELKAT
ncbi:MAG: DUF6065 family protein [Methylobacteriaceae bacterium]